MAPEFPEPFSQHYECLLKRLKLHGLQPKETLNKLSFPRRRESSLLN